MYLIERWVRHADPQFRSAGICIIDKLCHEVCLSVRAVFRLLDALWGWPLLCRALDGADDMYIQVGTSKPQWLTHP